MVIIHHAEPKAETNVPSRDFVRPVAHEKTPVPAGHRRLCLRRAWGPGFGTGELLCRLNGIEKSLEVVQSFLPDTIHDDATFLRRDWERKPVDLPLRDLHMGRYVIIQVAASSVLPPRCRVLCVDGMMVGGFRELSKQPMKLRELDRELMKAFTGVIKKGNGLLSYDQFVEITDKNANIERRFGFNDKRHEERQKVKAQVGQFKARQRNVLAQRTLPKPSVVQSVMFHFGRATA